MPLGDTVPRIPVGLPGRNMTPGGGWETIFGSQEPTIPQGPSTFGVPGTLGALVNQGPYEDWTGDHPNRRGGGALTAPASPVPSLNQIIAQATQPKPFTKGLGVESLLQNQVLGRILNSYYGDQAWKDLQTPFNDIAATPDFKTFEGGGGAYGYVDDMWGRILPSLQRPEMQDTDLEAVAGGPHKAKSETPPGPDTSGLPEIPFDLETVPPDQERPPVPYPAPAGYRWFWTPYGWILEEDI